MNPAIAANMTVRYRLHQTVLTNGKLEYFCITNNDVIRKQRNKNAKVKVSRVEIMMVLMTMCTMMKPHLSHRDLLGFGI